MYTWASIKRIYPTTITIESESGLDNPKNIFCDSEPNPKPNRGCLLWLDTG